MNRIGEDGMRVDREGQPLPLLNRGNRQRRTIAELLGLAKGIIADGVVSSAEVAFLRDWMRANPEAIDTWPCSVVAERLERIYADGCVDDDERSDLADLLLDVTGGGLDQVQGANPTTKLPLDDPVPALEFPDRVFVFTGRFLYGPRKTCEKVVRELGGDCSSSVTLKTNYLIIGDLGSRDWIQSSYGTKIEKAVDYRDRRGSPIAIVHEEDWAGAL